MIKKLRFKLRDLVETAFGAMLLVSALIHFSGPYFFLESALRYRILGLDLLVYVLPFLVSLQFLIAISFLVGFATRICFVLSAAMFSAFALGQIYVIFNGIPASCGCFGSVSSQVGFLSVSKVVCLSIIAAFFAFKGNSNKQRNKEWSK